jgi:hypothetical protein
MTTMSLGYSSESIAMEMWGFPEEAMKQSAGQTAAASVDVAVSAQVNASGWSNRPDATRSPEGKEVPVRNVTPADAADGPTVGANCRGILAADARGWLIMGGAMRASTGSGSEIEHELEGTQDIPRFRALRRDNTPNPAMVTMIRVVQACS